MSGVRLNVLSGQLSNQDGCIGAGRQGELELYCDFTALVLDVVADLIESIEIGLEQPNGVVLVAHDLVLEIHRLRQEPPVAASYEEYVADRTHLLVGHSAFD